MMYAAFLIILVAYVTLGNADVHMHNPRGSNNRLNEDTRERTNANRMFDSQNNNRGGYNVGAIYYYEGSELPVEWTSQHSCGERNADCQLVLQYMCSDQLRDGEVTRTIPDNPTQCKENDCNSDTRFGMNEDFGWYMTCKYTERNKGLFTANQNLQGDTEIYTRQNAAGTRRAYECPEERDYYPYWRPTPWRDIAIMTNDITRCPTLQAESQNVKEKWSCIPPPGYLEALYTNDLNALPTQYRKNLPLNKEDCEKIKFPINSDVTAQWKKTPAWGIKPPVCKTAPKSRDNHNGNGPNGFFNIFNWTIPDSLISEHCAMRLRYNISTADYDINTDASKNSEGNGAVTKVDISHLVGLSEAEAANRGYVFKTNPVVNPLNIAGSNIGSNLKLQVNINTAQFGRTFQERSHSFAIRKRPVELASATIKNLNVRGKRGNIVQVFPAVEYDFVPNRLTAEVGDYVHFQWTGSDTNPSDNAGQGIAGSDRSNVVLTKAKYFPKGVFPARTTPDKIKYGAQGTNYPEHLDKVNLLGFSRDALVNLAFGLSGQFKGDSAQYADAGQIQGDSLQYADAGNISSLLEKSKIVKTLTRLTNRWTLSVDIKPLGTISGWSSIVHATTGENINPDGSRVPGIWFHGGSSRLHICSSVNGNSNYQYNYPTALPLNEFTNVKVEQVLENENFVYRIYIGGQKVHEIVNNQPNNYDNVKLYASDPWYNPANAIIRNLEFDNRGDLLEQNRIVKNVRILSKRWTLSVDIKPLGIKSGLSNIVHATTGADMLEYGSRVPAIWFQSETSMLHISSAVNGNSNYTYKHLTALPMNVFTNVQIEQNLENEDYVYRIYIGGDKVHEIVNTEPSNFNNITLYASDPWYNSANAIIKNLELDNIGDLLEKNKIVKTLTRLSNRWTLSVDIKPLGTISGWASIVHATTGENISPYGSRVPGIWFHGGSSRLHICSSVNGDSNYQYNHPTALPLNKFTNVKVEQVLENENFVYRIYIDGEKVHEVVNNKPNNFYDVKLYAADPWYDPANAIISNLDFDNIGDLLEQNKLVKSLTLLSNRWSLSVDIKPLGTQSGLSNIVHATTDADMGEYGSRVPAIWFHSETSMLHISSAVNGNSSYTYNNPTALPLNQFTNVKVEQVLESNNYIFRIYVGGEKVHEVVNNKPSTFNNVKLYAADPWYKPANAMISNLEFNNKGDRLEKNTVVKTLTRLSNRWTLSVDIKPLGTISGWASIVHATTGENINPDGSRVPGIWFHGGSSRLHICSSINGNSNYQYNYPTALPLNKFTNVKVEQVLENENFVYRIYIDGAKVHEIVNNKPNNFYDVKLYAADPWYDPANAIISNLEFDNIGDVLEKNKLVKNIRLLSNRYSLSVDIKPLRTISGVSNIVHATTGEDLTRNGSRVPGIWFFSGSSRLYISSSVNGNSNYQYSHPAALPLNVFTNVKVEQNLENKEYVYRIFIGGEKVHEVINNKPSQYKSVSLYASDPWYNPAVSEIRNLEFDNIGDLLEKSKIVKTLRLLSNRWTLSVDIKPLGAISGWASIVHATTGENISPDGSRVPGIWFHGGSSRLHICSSVNGDSNYQYNYPTALPLNEFTNVKIEQVLENENFVYRIYIGGEKVHEVVNNKPNKYKNVTLYAADPWYNPANAIISNLEFETYLDLAQLNDADAYFDMKPMEITSSGIFYYMCTRNNAFTNRFQKGTLIVKDANAITTVGIVGDTSSAIYKNDALAQAIILEKDIETLIEKWKRFASDKNVAK